MSTEKFLKALTEQERTERPGTLMSVKDVRRRANMSKVEFDATAMALTVEGVITLTEHDFPTSLSREEREQLIQNSSGRRHFNGIVRRRST
jgi:hypothetical protein